MSTPKDDSPATGFRPFFNPATGEWITYTALAEDSDGQLVRFTWRSVPGGVITEHIHPHQEERFTILAREADCTSTVRNSSRAPPQRCRPGGCPALRGKPRTGRDQRRRRAPPGTAHQGVARGPCRPGGRRQDHAQGRAEEPVPARCHHVALPPRKPGHLTAHLGPEPHAPAIVGAGQGLRRPPLLRPLGQPGPRRSQ